MHEGDPTDNGRDVRARRQRGMPRPPCLQIESRVRESVASPDGGDSRNGGATPQGEVARVRPIRGSPRRHHRQVQAQRQPCRRIDARIRTLRRHYAKPERLKAMRRDCPPSASGHHPVGRSGSRRSERQGTRRRLCVTGLLRPSRHARRGQASFRPNRPSTGWAGRHSWPTRRARLRAAWRPARVIRRHLAGENPALHHPARGRSSLPPLALWSPTKAMGAPGLRPVPHPGGDLPKGEDLGALARSASRAAYSAAAGPKNPPPLRPSRPRPVGALLRAPPWRGRAGLAVLDLGDCARGGKGRNSFMG